MMAEATELRPGTGFDGIFEMKQTASKPVHSSVGGGVSSIRRGTLFGILANIVQVATRLITVPIVIAHLGLDGYGVWNIIVLAAAYMRFGSLGVKTAFQKYVADATGNGDYHAASRLLSTGCALMLALSILGIVGGLAFGTALTKAAGVPSAFSRSAADAISILAVIMAIANVGAVFEAMVAGAQRIDLLRKFSTALSVLEAVAIVTALSFGFGLATMAAVMGISELAFVLSCYRASRLVIPEVRVEPGLVSVDVCPELFRFAGSYQLLNVLEVVYISVVPFAVLHAFGAGAAGVYALATRVVTSAGLLQDAFLAPLLSAGASIFASGSAERMRDLVAKAFRTAMGLSMIPLGCVATFGATIIYAWTGQTDPTLGPVIGLVCFRALFQSLSLLALVLYRTSGSALHDNVRQVVRIVLMLGVALVARSIGFLAVLFGMAGVEAIGMVLMLAALKRTFPLFAMRSWIGDAARFAVATGLITLAGAIASLINFSANTGNRSAAMFQLAQVSVACLIAAYPVAVWTGILTHQERAALWGVVRLGRAASAWGRRRSR
jgi:O-antigen/teichoic acid export membrane protein